MKRNIQYIVVHCTGTLPTARLEAIQRYWKEVKKWNNPGYHYLIDRFGIVHQLQDEQKVANGVAGHNKESIHVCYIGGEDANGRPRDTRTAEQKVALFDKVMELSERYPQAAILGHRDFPNVAKACPCFDVGDWMENYLPKMAA